MFVDIIQLMILESSCLNYCIIGICVWLCCSNFECSVEISICVSYYNFDLVVSVYDEFGDNLWLEVKILYGVLEVQVIQGMVSIFYNVILGGGYWVEGGYYVIDYSLCFKEVIVIGYFFILFIDFVGNSGYYCFFEVEFMELVFLLGLDVLVWCFGLLEMLYLYNFILGCRVVGLGIQQQWGLVWLCMGFINQKDDVKVAAVIVQ